MTTFFYIAGVAFRLFAFALVALTLISVLAPSVRDQHRHFLRPLTWAFLAAASVVAAAYFWELLAAVTSTSPYVRFTFWHVRARGPFAWVYWLTLTCALVPQLLWLPRLRRQPLSILVIAGASLLPFVTERVIVAISSR